MVIIRGQAMSDPIKREQSTISSHELHNKGCFAYLQNIQLPKIIVDKLKLSEGDEALIGLAHLQRLSTGLEKEYDPRYAYADLFTRLCKINEKTILPFIAEKKQEYALIKNDLQDKISLDNFVIENPDLNDKEYVASHVDSKKEHIKQLAANEQRMHDLNNYVTSFFLNDNKHLKINYDYLKPTVDSLSPTSLSAEKAIKHLLHDKDSNTNFQTLSPEQAGSNPVLLATLVSPNFKPQHSTSLKSIVDNEEGESKLLRLGTIAQRHEGKPRLDPLVDHFFEAQAHEAPQKEITHVTINLLGRDREGFEGEKERELSLVIEEAENQHSKVAMITLPADKGLMAGSQYKDTKAKFSYKDTMDEFLLIATEDPAAQTKIKDFHISDKIRRLLFTNKQYEYSNETELAVLKDLLAQSAEKLNIDTTALISPAQKQALWFHFIKFELTNHILITLKPITYNIDCKDGIDRGAAHRAYYRLIKSIEVGNPMSRDTFQEALHAAAAGVKGRGMNHHHNMIWNAVDAYVSANYDSIKTNEKQSWMIEWRDWNCPVKRVDSVMKQSIDGLIQDLTDVTIPTKEIQEALKLLKDIDAIPGSSGKPKLFEAALRIHSLALNPTPDAGQQCEDLAEKIGVENPIYSILVGHIKKFVSEVMLKLSVGESMTNYFTSKVEEAKTGEHVNGRNAVQENMKHFLKGLKAEQPQENKAEKVQETASKRI